MMIFWKANKMEKQVPATAVLQFNKNIFKPTTRTDAMMESAKQQEEFFKSVRDVEKDKQLKWDLRFLELAKLISTWSKDPSTQTGAVIVDKNNRVISVGYNGFAKSVKDTDERYNNRELKYKIIVHCERNAIIFAQKNLEGCTLYTYPFMSCSTCASMVINAGITRCVAPPVPEDKRVRWEEDMKLSAELFKEAGVAVDIVEFK